MARIYLTGSGPTKGYATGSGIISNPVRILLQDRDNKTGSYPNIARTGDPDFTGAYSSFYDDTNTINFVGNNQTVYPTALPANSKWVSGGIATPNTLQGLITVGTASKGVADDHVSFTPGQSISPFTDSRVYIDSSNTFYQYGTPKTTLPGFDQKLSSKAILNFDISCKDRADIYWSTGTTGHASPYANSEAGYAAGIRSGIAYYSWTDRQWQMIGDLSTGSNVDFANPSVVFFTGSYLAQANSTSAGGFNASVITTATLGSMFTAGQPTNVAGFPVATKFDATGSQMLNLSNTLFSPFLVEKVVLTLGSASFRTEAGGFDPWNFGNQLPHNATFVLMHETGPEISARKSTTVSRVNSYGSSVDESQFTAEFSVKKNREIIWFGRVATFDETANSSPLAVNPSVIPYLTATWPTIYSCSEAWLPATNEAYKPYGYRGAYTGSIRIEAPSRLVPNSKKALMPGPFTYYNGSFGLYPNRRTTEVATGYVAFSASPEKGGRNLLDEPSGHSFIKTVPGSRVLSTTQTNWLTATPTSYYTVETRNLTFEVSPFVLTPNSRLILAVISQKWNIEENYITEKNYGKLTIFPANSSLSLYGTALRNNLPVSAEMNQPLTSEAIHEDLHCDNPVFDQFDVEPYTTLTGSYIDSIITGTMLASRTGDPFAANVRRVLGSAAAGTAGTTGSLQRFVSLVSDKDLFYDSIVPDAGEYISSLGYGFYQGSVGAVVNLVLATPDSTNWTPTSPSNFAVRNWYQTFPFERAVGRLRSQSVLSRATAKSYDFGETQISSAVSMTPGRLGIDTSDLVNRLIVVDQQGATEIGSQLKAVWGFGRRPYGAPQMVKVSSTTSNAYIRGMRYGLINAVSFYSSNKFRRDRFGQFRDMLEQAPNAAFVGPRNSVEHAVEISFVSRPARNGTGSDIVDALSTHSQNLSVFATSSLPYFDGIAVERSDDPDLTNTDVYVG